MSDIHFTSDTHLDHGNVIWYCDRPFVTDELRALKADYDKAKKTNASNFNVISNAYHGLMKVAVAKMNETITERWNDKIKPGDTVYHIGDVLFCDAEKAASMLKRLHGKKFLIYGNHDKTIKHNAELRSLFVKCSDYHEIRVPDSAAPRGEQMIVMSHYPFIVWNKSHHGSWMIHGHSHGGLKYPFEAKILDAGVDAHNLTPINYDEIKAIMKTKKIQEVDHHI